MNLLNKRKSLAKLPRLLAEQAEHRTQITHQNIQIKIKEKKMYTHRTSNKTCVHYFFPLFFFFIIILCTRAPPPLVLDAQTSRTAKVPKLSKNKHINSKIAQQQQRAAHRSKLLYKLK